MKWERLSSFLKIQSPWLTIHGEHWRDDKDDKLEYWRIERADSVVILPVQEESILLPKRFFRPGVNQESVDFPGGRVATDISLRKMVLKILKRELGINPEFVSAITPLNHAGWFVDSSFSNQKLFGFVAVIKKTAIIPEKMLYKRIPLNEVKSLLQSLECLQCRAILAEYFIRFM